MLVEDFGREVRAVGPGDRPGFGVYLYLREGIGVAQGREHAGPVTQVGQVDVADQAVRERQPEPVVAEDLDVGNVVERRDHGRILRERRDRHGELMCCHKFPVVEQLVLVERGPLEDLPEHARRERSGQDGERLDADGCRLPDVPRVEMPVIRSCR